MTKRIHMSIRGVVQGVGFRPFVYSLAQRYGLAGWVLNESRGVELEVEGAAEDVARFAAELEAAPPPLARIEAVERRDTLPRGERGFLIRQSAEGDERSVLIAPDMATCPDCLRELRDPDDRRYGYPFINCTNCGPRYTIIRDVPYDRANTTMAAFAMCGACRAEYEDPADRRFHAEPACCPACGPRVWLADAQGREVGAEQPIAEAAEALRRGDAVAVKGLGGFHLACDARNPEAVRRLRKRKRRDLKPFAVMAAAVEAAEALGTLTSAERKLLVSPERPIVLLRKREGHGLANEVAPRSDAFGVMLPYTPLHHLLLEAFAREGQPPPVLVMTSGNLSDEPIAHENEDAVARLGPLCDVFLLHDRPIHIRTDDSVVRTAGGAPRFLRRSRGYAPFPVTLPIDVRGREILAVGAELSNTLCLSRGRHAFMSHHIGDLRNVAAYESFKQAAGHLEKLLGVEPRVVAADLHPGYLSTGYARERGLPIVSVQHHHAHAASVLAEHGRDERVVGVSFDGLGLGEEGGLWGGEFITCGLADYRREAHLEPVPQPGGDAAARHIDRMAYAFLRAAYGAGADAKAVELLPRFARGEMPLVRQMLETGVNCPLTSSMGRLFDAAAALLGICHENAYHAQAPMELEAAAWEARHEAGWYETPIDWPAGGAGVARTAAVARQLVEDVLRGTAPAVCAARFHNSVAQLTSAACQAIARRSGLGTVTLSGGVMANAFLLDRVCKLLEADGLEALLNRTAPPGDGGISLGQCAVAAARMRDAPPSRQAD